MAIQIALSWSKECAAELIAKGFKQQEVYIKSVVGGITTKKQVKIGDTEFFGMKHIPYQFVTTSWWGAEPE